MALPAVLVAVLISAGCQFTPVTDPGPGPDAAVAAFAQAWSSTDATSVAALTSDPGAAALQLSAVVSDLGPTAIAVRVERIDRVDDGLATATAALTWTLPGPAAAKGPDPAPGPARGAGSAAGAAPSTVSWTYANTWRFRRSGTDATPHWTVDWSPAVVNPQLSEGQTIALRPEAPTSGQVLDRTGSPLVAPVRVYSVLAAPTRITDVPATAARLAALLGPVDPTVTVAAVTAGIRSATPTTGYTVTNLREPEYQQVQGELAKLPGLTFPSRMRDLPPTRNFAKAVLAQAQPKLDRLTTGLPGWRIVSVDAAGDELETLARQVPVDGANATVTLDPVVQLAAQSVIANQLRPSVVVAIQPSSGEILAVAQNTAADALGPIALTGLYPPGSTFKIVTASAALDAGLITPQTPVPCPGRTAIGGRLVRNYKEFDLGTVPVTMAFARSCNTTFAGLAAQLDPGALTAAAKAYGIGLDFDVPGLTTLTGQVPVAPNVILRAANGFGQGTVLVTPLAEALMAATVDHGSLPMPVLIRGQRTTVSAPPPIRSAATRSGLPELMRAVVLEGTGQALQGVGETYLKTGSAEYALPDGTRHAHAWSVGYTGDLAFVVMIVGGDNSSVTARMARSFITQALPR